MPKPERYNIPPTYAERELIPYGYVTTERHEIDPIRIDKVSMELGVTAVTLECVCPNYPSQKAMGCPLHHEGIGGSWPIVDAKIAAIDRPDFVQ